MNLMKVQDKVWKEGLVDPRLKIIIILILLRLDPSFYCISKYYTGVSLSLSLSLALSLSLSTFVTILLCLNYCLWPCSFAITRPGRVGCCFCVFYGQERLKAQPAVVLVLKRLRRWGHGLKSHPTDWEKPGIEPAAP